MILPCYYIWSFKKIWADAFILSEIHQSDFFCAKIEASGQSGHNLSHNHVKIPKKKYVF